MLCLALFACDAGPGRAVTPSTPSPGSSEKSAAPSPDQILIEGVQVERWVGDRLRHRGEAERARVDRGSGDVVADRVEGEVFDAETGAIRATFRARSAQGPLHGDTVTLSGGVQITDAAQRQIVTERATYHGQTSRIRAPGPVEVTGANFRSTGANMDARLDDQTIDVGGPVRAIFDAPPPD